MLRAAPLDVPAGSFRAGDQQLLVRADAAVTKEEDISSLIIRDDIRIGQVAKVAFSPEDSTGFVRLNGERVVGISVVRQAGSNTIRIADGVRAAVADINARMDGVELDIISDNAIFIRGSVSEVVTTLVDINPCGDRHDSTVYRIHAAHAHPRHCHTNIATGYTGS